MVVEGNGGLVGLGNRLGVELLDDFVQRVADANVEHVVVDGKGPSRLVELDEYQTDGSNGENGDDKDAYPAFHGARVWVLVNTC